MKVQLYTRHNGSRQYEKVSAKASFKGGNFPIGTIFVLRYVREGKRVFETLRDCQNLKTAFERRAERELDLIRGKVPIRAPRKVAATIPVAQTPSNAVSDTLMLDAAIDKYLAVTTQTKHANTASGYHHTLKQFYRAIGNKLLTSVSRDDFYKFIGFLKEEGLADRTISNRCSEVTTLLRHFGIKDVTVKVKYTDKKVRAYRPDELNKLFAASTLEEWALFQFFLGTGARDQEVMFATWDDIDFEDGIFTVHEHPEFGFTPKDKEEREIPLHDGLVAMLRERKAISTTDLIFPTADGKPNYHFLRIIKALAKRAGVREEIAGLHVFRKTYATLQHRAGVDARTIQKRLGHSDLATTLAYLEGEEARSERSREQVNGTFGVFAARAMAAVEWHRSKILEVARTTG
jgi:integrase/recombinase XerD